MKVLVIQGAGMNMRGKVDIELFGRMTLEELNELIRGYATKLELEVEFCAAKLSRIGDWIWSVQLLPRVAGHQGDTGWVKLIARRLPAGVAPFASRNRWSERTFRGARPSRSVCER